MRDPFISDLFALVVFLCDDLLTLKAVSSDPSSSNKASRFFVIAQLLPMELQMALCNRAFGSSKNSEPAFKKLGKVLAWSEMK